MQDYIEQITAAGKNSYVALQELGEINSKAIIKLTELQFEFATKTIENSLEQVNSLSKLTNYKDFLAKSSDITSNYSNGAIGYSKQTAAVLTESRDEIVDWIEKGLEKNTKTTKTTAKRSTK